MIKEVQEQLNSNLSIKRYEYSGMPEQFQLHLKQAMHTVKWAGLVDTSCAAHEKCKSAQKNWDKVVTSIIKYEKKNKEYGGRCSC